MIRNLSGIKRRIYRVLNRDPQSFSIPQNDNDWNEFINSFSELGYCDGKSIVSEIKKKGDVTLDNGKVKTTSYEGVLKFSLLQTSDTDLERYNDIEMKEQDLLLFSENFGTCIFYPKALLNFDEKIQNGQVEKIEASYAADELSSKDEFRIRFTYNPSKTDSILMMGNSFSDDFTRNNSPIYSALKTFTLNNTSGHVQGVVFDYMNTKRLFLFLMDRTNNQALTSIYHYDGTAFSYVQDVIFNVGSGFDHPSGATLDKDGNILVAISDFPGNNTKLVRMNPSDLTYAILAEYDFHMGALTWNGAYIIGAGNKNANTPNEYFYFISPDDFSVKFKVSFAALSNSNWVINDIQHVENDDFFITVWDTNSPPAYASKWGKMSRIRLTTDSVQLTKEFLTPAYIGYFDGEQRLDWLAREGFYPMDSEFEEWVWAPEDWENGMNSRIFIGPINCALIEKWAVRQNGIENTHSVGDNPSVLENNKIKLHTSVEDEYHGLAYYNGFNHENTSKRYLNMKIRINMEASSDILIGYYGIKGDKYTAISPKTTTNTLYWRDANSWQNANYSVQANTDYIIKITFDKTDNRSRIEFCDQNENVLRDNRNLIPDPMSSETDQTGFVMQVRNGTVYIDDLFLEFSDTPLVNP